MSESWCVLHISDLHIHNPKDTSAQAELLRSGYYEEYLENLVAALNHEKCSRVDALVVTGDFVNQAQTQHLDHAGLVIDFLADKLRLPRKKVVVCPGNHDLSRDLEHQGRSAEARDPIYTFLKRYAWGHPVETFNEGVLSRIDDRIWALMLDSMMGEPPHASPEFALAPSKLPLRCRDEILGIVRKHLTRRDDFLIVASHYPIDSFKKEMNSQDPDFHKRRVWTAAKHLSQRIGRGRVHQKARTLWLSGDLHIQCQDYRDGIHFITAGHFGGATGLGDSQQRRQAKLIRFSSHDDSASITTFENVVEGHETDPETVEWRPNTAELKGFGPKWEGNESPIALHSSVRATVVERLEDTPASESFRTDTGLEQFILDCIAEDKLYVLDRFKTNTDEVSLSWVSIGALLNVPGILPNLVDRTVRWIRWKAGGMNIDPDQAHVVLLGVDCWGAVIASQITVITGWVNLCVAGRSLDERATEFEKVRSRVPREVKNASLVVLVSDVVATGHTINNVYREAQRQLGGDCCAAKWLSVSVLCDESVDRSGRCGFLSAQGAACTTLRMLVMPNTSLPSEKILPPALSFVGEKSGKRS